MENPYAGTEWADTYTQGYDAGRANPWGEASAPAVLEDIASQVYLEGVLAGQLASQADGVPIGLNPSPKETDHNAIHTVTTTLGVGLLALEIAHFSPLGILIELLVFSCELETFPTNLGDPNQLSQAIADACRSQGVNELFMALCQDSNHSSSGDAVFDAGYWHSNLLIDYWTAYNAAVAHLTSEPDALGQVGVVRVHDDPNNSAEWIVLE